jgi:hypothetical protein
VPYYALNVADGIQTGNGCTFVVNVPHFSSRHSAKLEARHHLENDDNHDGD